MILVTGAAGFIGYHLSKRLVEAGLDVVGLDSMTPYYDVTLKQDRIKTIFDHPKFEFRKIDLADRDKMEKLFKEFQFDVVVNLAAQAGVRYSLKHPHTYTRSNVEGFLNILEGCRHTNVQHLLFASSSSVYGSNTKMPLSNHDNVDHPISLYAATKKANEMMAHSYSHLYGIPCTGLRFFTVYGPWGRPDLSLFIFTKAIFENTSFEVFNYGDMERDFTYIDDVVEGIIRVMIKPPERNPDWDATNPDPSISNAPFKIYNIGNNSPINLKVFIEILEQTIGKTCKKYFVGMQDGDVRKTYADVDDLQNDVGFKPSTPVEVGIKNFVDWYKKYYKVGE